MPIIWGIKKQILLTYLSGLSTSPFLKDMKAVIEMESCIYCSLNASVFWTDEIFSTLLVPGKFCRESKFILDVDCSGNCV